MSYGSCKSTVAEFAVIQVCPTGQHWDTTQEKCVVDTPDSCPVGQHWDPVLLQCVDDIHTCPTGYHWDETTGTCVLDGDGNNNLLIAAGVVSVIAIGTGAYYATKKKKKTKGEK